MWPNGTARWDRTRILIVSSDRSRRNRLLNAWSDADVVVATTPLEALIHLELNGPSISTVVLADLVGSVTGAELAEYLDENYPFVRVILTETSRSDRDPASTTTSREGRV